MNTNKVLKKMMSNANRYTKDKLVNVLAVDIENCYPIDFKGQKYSYKKHKNCLFLYLDAEYNLMGILKGSTHTDNFESVEVYSEQRTVNTRFSIIKNRKHMEPEATYILMLTPSMRDYSAESKKRNNNDDHRRKLKQRLLEYKTKKYQNIDHDEIQTMIIEVLTLMTNNLFTDKEQDILEKTYNINRWCSEDLTEPIRTFSSIVKEYKRVYEEVKKKQFGNYYQRELNKIRTKIIRWYNELMKYNKKCS